MTDVDDYIASVPSAERAEFERIRRIVAETVPDTEQGRSYGMPALKYRGKPLISFMVTKKHLSIYPFSGKVIDRVRNQLTEFELTTGSIHFSAAHPIPESILREIVSLRRQEIDARDAPR